MTKKIVYGFFYWKHLSFCFWKHIAVIVIKKKKKKSSWLRIALFHRVKTWKPTKFYKIECLINIIEREMKMSNNTYTVPESYPMNGGDGINSYTKNSSSQVSLILLSISPISYTLLILSLVDPILARYVAY